MSIIVLSIISLIIVTSFIFIVLNRSKECEPGFSGKNCENKSEGDEIKCVDNICGNNGRCEEFNFRENYKCTCNPGFTGDNCQDKIKIDYCARAGNPCMFGTRCENLENDYKCHCTLIGFSSGKHCDQNVIAQNPLPPRIQRPPRLPPRLTAAGKHATKRK